MSSQTNRPSLRKGSSGAAVKTLQMLLNGNLGGRKPLKTDGSFGPGTENAVKDFQRRKGLKADGVVGPKTWAALESHPNVQMLYRYRPGPQEPLADIARPYIGATEAKGNRIGSDRRMREIFEADSLSIKGRTDGYAWCCAFVSMCVQKLIAQNPAYHLVSPPRTPAVFDFRTRWAPTQNCLIFSPNDPHQSPHKGDIVVYTFSHIGIVDTVGENMVKTIEGNTNEAGSREGTACLQKDRGFGIIRCFIRLPIPAHYDLDNQACLVAPQT